jgi:hypothetical protein
MEQQTRGSDLAVTKKQDLDSNGGFAIHHSVVMSTRSTEREQKITVTNGNESYADLVFQCPTSSEESMHASPRHRLEHFAVLSGS